MSLKNIFQLRLEPNPNKTLQKCIPENMLHSFCILISKVETITKAALGQTNFGWKTLVNHQTSEHVKLIRYLDRLDIVQPSNPMTLLINKNPYRTKNWT